MITEAKSIDEILNLLSGESFDAAINNPNDYMIILDSSVAAAKSELRSLIEKEVIGEINLTSVTALTKETFFVPSSEQN